MGSPGRGPHLELAPRRSYPIYRLPLPVFARDGHGRAPRPRPAFGASAHSGARRDRGLIGQLICNVTVIRHVHFYILGGGHKRWCQRDRQNAILQAAHQRPWSSRFKCGGLDWRGASRARAQDCGDVPQLARASGVRQ